MSQEPGEDVAGPVLRVSGVRWGCGLLWGLAAFQAQVVVGKIHFHAAVEPMAACFSQSQQNIESLTSPIFNL